MFQCREIYIVKPVMLIVKRQLKASICEAGLGTSNINGAGRDTSGTHGMSCLMNVYAQEALCG